MMKHIILPAVCSFCAAVLLFLPSCKKSEPEQDLSDYGSMNITSSPSGAEVSILGKVIGATPRITNPVPASMYIVKIAMNGYEPTWVPVKVVAGRQVDVHADLVPETATVIIDSNPSGAHVRIGDKDYGDTPLLLPDLPLGSYSASVYLEGYTRRDIPWKVQNGRPMLINVTMMNNVGTLAVTTEPKSVEIEIDGKAYGSTPFRELLEQGQHVIRLTKTGYKPYEKPIDVTRDEIKSVNVTLEKLPGSLSITSNPSGAALFIDGQDYGTTPYTRESIDAGDYTVRLVMDGFDPLEQTVTVHPGEPMERSFTLDPNTGTIVLSINPPGMSVFLDGRFICRTEPDPKSNSRDVSKRVTFKNISAGDHTITVSNKHAKPNVKDISITVGKGKTVQVPELNIWLPDTEIVLNNGSRYTGRITDRYSENSGKIAFMLSARTGNDGKLTSTIINEFDRSDIKEIIPLNVVDGD